MSTSFTSIKQDVYNWVLQQLQNPKAPNAAAVCLAGICKDALNNIRPARACSRSTCHLLPLRLHSHLTACMPMVIALSTQAIARSAQCHLSLQRGIISDLFVTSRAATSHTLYMCLTNARDARHPTVPSIKKRPGTRGKETWHDQCIDGCG